MTVATPRAARGRGHGTRGVHGARGDRVWRLPVLALVVLSLVGAGLADRTVGSPSSSPPTVLASAAAPVGAESSSWYCTGGTGTASGAASGTLYLVNIGRQAVTGTVTVVDDAGSSASAAVTVAAGSETTVVPSQVVQGDWLASTVDLDGGGVTVSELVDGPQGWAQAPCATTTSPRWYFASGSTANGSTLYVSLFNPTTTAAVVDLTFVTAQGVSQPQAFEGLVVAPGALVVAGVASYVQDQPSVSTIVEARSGRVVAGELEEHTVGGVSGLSLRLGSPTLESRWILPRTVDVTDGTSKMVVFNPSSVSQRVTVTVQLPSGPVAPYVHEVPADTTWTLVTSRSIRIPPNTDYATTVSSAAGPGVVVDRVVQSSSAGVVPQWGAVSAVGVGAASTPSRQWVVPTPAVPASPPVAGAAPFALALQNPGSRAVTVSVSTVTPAGDHRLTVLRIPPGVFTVVEPATLAVTSSDPLVLRSSGPLAAMEDESPAGMPGAVALPAIPQGE